MIPQRGITVILCLIEGDWVWSPDKDGAHQFSSKEEALTQGHNCLAKAFEHRVKVREV